MKLPALVFGILHSISTMSDTFPTVSLVSCLYLSICLAQLAPLRAQYATPAHLALSDIVSISNMKRYRSSDTRVLDLTERAPVHFALCYTLLMLNIICNTFGSFAFRDVWLFPNTNALKTFHSWLLFLFVFIKCFFF